MMKYLMLSGLILLYFLLTAKSCEDNSTVTQEQEDAALKAKLDSVKTQLQSDYLNEATIRAFEENAKQKLVDFADYLDIYTNSDIDSSFRNQAAIMITDLFYTKDIHFSIELPGKPGLRKVSLDELINKNLYSGYRAIEFLIDSVNLVRPFQPKDTSGFTGVLGFRYKFRGYAGKDTIAGKASFKKIDITLRKVGKAFGKDKVMVWKVFLGDIKE